MGLAKGGRVILGNVKKLPKELQGSPIEGVLHKPGSLRRTWKVLQQE